DGEAIVGRVDGEEPIARRRDRERSHVPALEVHECRSGRLRRPEAEEHGSQASERPNRTRRHARPSRDGGGGRVYHTLRRPGRGKSRLGPGVVRPPEGRIRIPPPMARAPVEGPEQLFHFAKAAAWARIAPAAEPPPALAEPAAPAPSTRML